MWNVCEPGGHMLSATNNVEHVIVCDVGWYTVSFITIWIGTQHKYSDLNLRSCHMQGLHLFDGDVIQKGQMQTND